jgi:hypothetical protein
VPIVSIETQIHTSSVLRMEPLMCFMDQQHNRCENAFRLASSTRKVGASGEAGAQELAIRFRGNDTPSALIRRPGEGGGKGNAWGYTEERLM